MLFINILFLIFKMKPDEKHLTPLEKKMVKLCRELITESERSEKEGTVITPAMEKTRDGWKGTLNNTLKIAGMRAAVQQKLKSNLLNGKEKDEAVMFLEKANAFTEKQEQVYEWLVFNQQQLPDKKFSRKK